MDDEMDKRKFLKTSGVFLGGGLLSRFASGESALLPDIAPRKNWSGNFAYFGSIAEGGMVNSLAQCGLTL